MADTIGTYLWKGSDAKTIDEVQYDQVGAQQSRQEYDRMVKDASREADRHFEQQAIKKTRQAEARQQKEQEQKAQQLEQERAELQKQIEEIQKRGYSPTFTKGMQDNLIKEVQEKIDQLEGGAGS